MKKIDLPDNAALTIAPETEAKRTRAKESAHARLLRRRETEIKDFLQKRTAIEESAQKARLADAGPDRETPEINIGEILRSKNVRSVPMTSLGEPFKAAEVLTQNTRAAQNGDPNGAFTINMATLYQDVITAAGEQRWYNFQVAETGRKLTVRMMPVADPGIDNDLALYKLDLSTYMLSQVAHSSNYPGMYEQLSYNAEPGIYYICVSAYACAAANAFQFLCLSADMGDAYEADDSMALAKEQEVGKIVRRSLDNSLDDDCTVFLVPEDGDYHFILQDVPENCNYELQIFSSDQQLLISVPKNTSMNLTGFIKGGYYLRVCAPDGAVDPAALYTVLITPIPSGLRDLRHYQCDLTNDRTHFVEGVYFPASAASVSAESRLFYPTQWVVYIDGVLLDISQLETQFGRPYLPTGITHKCGGRTTSKSYMHGYKVGSYGSMKAPAVMGLLKNAVLVEIENALYSFYHSQQIPNKNPRVYSDVLDWPVSFVVNMDTRQPVDNMYPNWFYGFKDSYPDGVGQENASFSTIDGEYIVEPKG